MIPLHAWIPPPSLGLPAQVVQDEEFEMLELRVTSVLPRQAIVDRGAIDGLAVKDRVVFRPRDGRIFEGTVVQVGERDAVVELDDPAIVPVPGTKGEARIPSSRRAPREAPESAPPATLEHPPWERKDDEWKPGEPLLAHVRPFRPDEREVRITGRAYTIFDFAHSTEGSRSDSFARAGTSLLFENPFGGGGELHFDGEVNYRRTDVPDTDDEEKQRLRLDRLSYSWGGHRFAPERVEIGRFLQHDMPEFGVLDGAQWSRRLPGGNTFGASFGLLPEPDAEQSTGDNLQIAAYYRWVADESEQLSLAGGYQKTFHHLDADRDLFVGKIVFLPVRGWSVTGTAWVDYYTAGDEAKGPGLGLSQAYVSTGKRWENGSRLRFTYTHLEFPENNFDAFTPVTFDQLANDHVERVSASARQAVGDHFGLFGQAGGWSDQDDAGGDGEVGIDTEDSLFEGSRIELAGFYTAGRFSTTVGGRAAIGSMAAPLSWRVGYDFSYDDVAGFAADNNSIPQHRVRASLDVHTGSSWSLSTYVDVILFDQESSVLAGLFLQRSF